MFDFEKLDVYQKIKGLNVRVFLYLKNNQELDPYIIDQWRRASLSILLNLAEGTGRIANQEKKHYITIARSSVFESVAILDFLKEAGDLAEKDYENLYADYETISKMLLGMYRSFNK